MSTILASKNLNKSYGRTEAVRNLTMNLEENTIYDLLGRNGAGKTTLLNILTGGIFPDTGDIVIADQRLQPGDSQPKPVISARRTSSSVELQLSRVLSWHPHSIRIGIGRSHRS